MVCKVCGRNITNESANFCEYCGTSFREGYKVETTYQNEKNNDTTFVNKGDSTTISFGNWLGSLALQFIPIVGIVMLFIWAFGSDVPKTKKNWARAQLIVTIVAFVYFAFFITTSVMNTLNGTDMNEFLKSYNNISQK